jgi:hypothetical protein
LISIHRTASDEHISGAVAKGLYSRGIDVLTLVDAEMLGASDEEHFAFAREEGRTIVTYDDDFLRLADQTSDHPGVVYAPQSRGVGEMVRGLALLADVLSPDEMRGHIEFL